MTRKHRCRLQLAASEPVAYRLVYMFVTDSIYNTIRRRTRRMFLEVEKVLQQL